MSLSSKPSLRYECKTSATDVLFMIMIPDFYALVGRWDEFLIISLSYCQYVKHTIHKKPDYTLLPWHFKVADYFKKKICTLPHSARCCTRLQLLHIVLNQQTQVLGTNLELFSRQELFDLTKRRCISRTDKQTYME
jgi:hypothetical protein